jgi:hypothetical protein
LQTEHNDEKEFDRVAEEICVKSLQ